MPAFALPLDSLADAETALAHVDAIRETGASFLLLRLDQTREAADGGFMPLAELVEKTGAGLELQVILAGSSTIMPNGNCANWYRAWRRPVCSRARGRIREDRRTELSAGEERPPHPSEEAIAGGLARHFPQSVHIGGTPAFFTEFNRKRAGPALWKGLTFATTPVVHAADDASVMETLQALPHIMVGDRTCRGLPLSVGPTVSERASIPMEPRQPATGARRWRRGIRGNVGCSRAGLDGPDIWRGSRHSRRSASHSAPRPAPSALFRRRRIIRGHCGTACPRERAIRSITLPAGSPEQPAARSWKPPPKEAYRAWSGARTAGARRLWPI